MKLFVFVTTCLFLFNTLLSQSLAYQLNKKDPNYFCEKTFDGKLIKEGFRVNDSVYGEMRVYEQGKLLSIMHFVNEELNGPYAAYFFESGKIYLIGNHKNGKKDGVWKEYEVSSNFKLHKYNADEEVFLTKKDSLEALLIGTWRSSGIDPTTNKKIAEPGEYWTISLYSSGTFRREYTIPSDKKDYKKPDIYIEWKADGKWRVSNDGKQLEFFQGDAPSSDPKYDNSLFQITYQIIIKNNKITFYNTKAEWDLGIYEMIIEK